MFIAEKLRDKKCTIQRRKGETQDRVTLEHLDAELGVHTISIFKPDQGFI